MLCSSRTETVPSKRVLTSTHSSWPNNALPLVRSYKSDKTSPFWETPSTVAVVPRWIALAPLDAQQEGDGFPHIATVKGTRRGGRSAPPLMRMRARARRRDDTVVGHVDSLKSASVMIKKLSGGCGAPLGCPLCTAILRFGSMTTQLKRRQARLIAREFDSAIVKNKRDPVISEAVVASTASTFMPYQPRPCGQFTVNWHGLVEPLFDSIISLSLGQNQNRIGSSAPQRK